MIRPVLLLLFLLSGVLSLFSVQDDVLAFPQYEIQFPDAFITEEDANVRLARRPQSSFMPRGSDADPSDEAVDDNADSYEMMWMKGKKFLCSIPVVKPPPPMNATERELSKVEEDKELARATNRGWELLSDLEGKCLYFVSGWWSYSFCHNREVRQFHQLPPQPNNQWPPTEDPETQSYVLGKASPESYKSKSDRAQKTELQATGELRFLVQKLGGGTICDLTGKERKIEVQFHCNSHGTDRIGWIKEVTVCCYLMVIYTPRLCNDVAFLPPRENRANGISCKEIMNNQQVDEFYKLKAELEQMEAMKLLEKAATKKSDISGEDSSEDGEGKKGKKDASDAEDDFLVFLRQEL